MIASFGVASENVASRKSLAMLSCGVLGALLGGIAGYLLGVYYLNPIFPSQEPGWRPSLLFPSYFRKTWGTILLAVCLVLRRETSVFGPCFLVQKHKTLYDDYMCRHCPDTAIHDNTSLLVSVSSLGLKMIQLFCRIGTMTSWDACKPTVGFTAALTLHSNGWTKLWSPPSGFGCKVYHLTRDGRGRMSWIFVAWRLWKSSKMTVVPSRSSSRF